MISTGVSGDFLSMNPSGYIRLSKESIFPIRLPYTHYDTDMLIIPDTVQFTS